jgi:hypothetical protein
MTSPRPILRLRTAAPPPAPVPVPMPTAPAAATVGKKHRLDPARFATLRLNCRQRWPEVFGPTPVPLAVGSRAVIADALPGATPAEVRTFLSIWTTRRSYLEALARPGSQRVNLATGDLEPVAEEHRIHAANRQHHHRGQLSQGGDATTPNPTATT